MSNLQIFKFEEKQIRTIKLNEEPWFVARDLCNALEIKDVSMAVSRLDNDEKGTSSICTLGGIQKMNVVNESGLYSLVLSSRKPEANVFRKWVTSEVIPTIRKTGSYGKTLQMSQAELTYKLAEQNLDHENRIMALEKAVGTSPIPLLSTPETVDFPVESVNVIPVSDSNKKTKKDDSYSSVKDFYSALGISLTGGQSRGISRSAKALCKKRGLEVKSTPRSSTANSEVGFFPKSILREVILEKKLI